MIVDADIAITAADTAVAGSAIEVKWTGLSNDHDRITIANSDSAASDALSRVYTERDQSVEIKTPDTPGEYEIRYVTRKQGEIFARKKITVISE